MDKDLIQHIIVPQSRLTSGSWAGERETSEGDIHASYSADLIGMTNKVRKPFHHGAYLWTCVSIAGRGNNGQEFESYRLTPEAIFTEPVTSYAAKVGIDGGAAARNDPKGFYHGVAVQHGGARYVLTGTPSLFLADPEVDAHVPAQLDLFGSEAEP